jgi:hypothetical protein
MGFLEDIFDFFRAVLDFIREYWVVLLAIAIVVMAVFFPGALAIAWTWLVEVGMPQLAAWGSAVGSFFAELGILGTVAATLGIGLLIDPEGTSEAIGDIVDSVGGAAGSVAGGVLGAVLSSPITWVAAGAAALYFFASRDDSDSDTAGGGTDVYVDRGPYRSGRDPYNYEEY